MRIRKAFIFIFVLVFFARQNYGYTFLNKIDLKAQKSVKINKNWFFTTDPEGVLSPKDFRDLSFWEKANWRIINLPFDWNSEDSPYRGYRGRAWYVYVFSIEHINKSDIILADLGYIYDTDKTYLNGHLIGKTGDIRFNHIAYDQLRLYPLSFQILRKNAPNILAVMVESYENISRGLVKGRYLIGQHETIEEFHRVAFGINLGIFLITISSGLYFLVFYIRRKKEAKDFLYFSLFSISYGIYHIFTTTNIKYAIFKTFILGKKIQHMLLLLPPVFFMLFVKHFFKLKSKTIELITIIISFLATLIGIAYIVLGTNLYDLIHLLFYFVHPYLLFTIIILIIIILHLSIKEKDKNAQRLLFGILILLGTVVYDILVAEEVIKSPIFISGFGIIFLIWNTSIVLSKEFIDTYKELKELKEKLEEKVKEQTKELREKYNEIRTQLEFAREIQHKLLPPKENEPPYLEVVNLYLPMELLGGDFFYYFPIDEHRWFFYMVDVSGHGVAASLLASMAKTSFNSRVIEKKEISPARILFEVNKDFLDIRGKGFLTACAILYDSITKKMIYSNAGHTLPILCSRKDYPKTIYLRGVPIGIRPDPKYQEKEIQLKPNDRIFFYTDGIIEVTNEEGELFGEERLMEIIKRGEQIPLFALVNQIIMEYWDFNATGYQNDDISLVGIEIK